MPNDKQSFLQRAKMAANKVYLDATDKLVMDRPSYGRDQSEKRTMVEMSRRQGEQEYWDYLKRNSADEFYKQASVNLGQTSGPRPMDAVTQGVSHVAESREAPGWLQTGLRYAPLAGQVAMSVLSKGEAGFPRINEEPMPMPAPGMRLNLAPGKAMEIAKTKAVAPGGAPAGDLGELETGLQASAKRMFPSVEERTAGTEIGKAIASRKMTLGPSEPYKGAVASYANRGVQTAPIMDATGKEAGVVHYEVKGPTAEIHWIGDRAQTMGADSLSNKLGKGNIRSLGKQLMDRHPEVQKLEGQRIGGLKGKELGTTEYSRQQLDPHSEVLDAWTKLARPPEQ